MSITLPVKERTKSVNTAGFLLPELLIALIVLMGMATVVATYQWHTIRWHGEATQQAAALTRIMNVIEQYTLSAELPAQEQEVDGIKICWRREPVAVQTSATAFMTTMQPRFELLIVEAQWIVAGTARTLNIVAGACHA
jgi:Tfp pilus assembly protein PilV